MSPVAVDDLLVVDDFIAPADHHRIQPRCLDRGCTGENLGFAPEGREADIAAVVDYSRLAGQPVGVAQEGFAGASGTERVHPLLNFYNALMTGSGPAAGGGHLDPQLVCVVEKRPARLQLEASIIVPNGAHRVSCLSHRPGSPPSSAWVSQALR